MPFPEIARSSAPLAPTDCDALVLALPPQEDDADSPGLSDWPGLADSLAAVEFTGAVGTVVRVGAPGAPRTPLFVVGTGKEPDAAAWRTAVGAAVRSINGRAHVRVGIPGAGAADAAAAAEGAALGGYRFDDYKSGERKGGPELVTLHSEQLDDDDLERARALADAVALVKDLTTIPAEWMGPADLAERAQQAVADLPVEVEILDEAALAEGGFGGILGVGQGSARPPRLVRLSYTPADATRHVALVGKGITFDTGGLSLKPAGSMVGMKDDMCGAASVLAVIQAAARLRLPVRVTAWMCIADNMPSGSAIRPGDVLRIADGQTVEVLNTDAEGRLVLADGLVAASRENPDVIVDVATLTGAIMTALGSRHTGVMGDDDTVARYLIASDVTGELGWPMPLPEHMESELDSPIADLVNAKIGDPLGGALFAGLFLRRFVGRRGEEDDAPRIAWAHLDIAGSGWHKGAPYGFTDKGATGASVRALVAFLESEAKES
ncbi:aminopeptidase A [Microbacterium mangrovi]|uniref:Probable cytosol aminopeptidase n=1 Tax=Microbacterium mangrovi TaxID=1348253 RepID=A0A0B2A6W3_9MICO|nr:leucyl aminopeptidase [Microbacterium mangrovi]KHK97336.1 aminopeptidase A [Microbacterium mangrovi]